MAQIRSINVQPRRPGELGVHSVDHFNFVVPDLKQAASFYGSFGLDVREEGQGLGLYAFGHEHRWGRVNEGAAKKFTYLSFGASSCPPGVQGSHARSRAPVVKPRRLAHILIFTSDVLRAIDFYGCIVGLRLSDRSGDGVAFMHGVHGSDHHMVAFAKSNGPGLHHLSWDVDSIHEVGLGAMQMADKGFSAGWGMGRHVLGSNCFHYVRDAWGSYSEYSSDIDYIPVNHDWPAADHPGHDAFYVRGSNPPEDFVVNHETAA